MFNPIDQSCIVMLICQSDTNQDWARPLACPFDVLKRVISSFGPKISFTNSLKAPGRCGEINNEIVFDTIIDQSPLFHLWHPVNVIVPTRNHTTNGLPFDILSQYF